MKERWIRDIHDNVKRTLVIGSMLDPRFKNIAQVAPEFADWDKEKDEIFQFEFLSRWVPKESNVEMDAPVMTPVSRAASPSSPANTGTGPISMSSFLSLTRCLCLTHCHNKRTLNFHNLKSGTHTTMSDKYCSSLWFRV